MEYVYAAMLLHKANQKIDENGIKKVLEAAGVEVDDSRVKALVAALDGVDIEKAIKEAAVAPAQAAPAAAPAEEEKKDEDKDDKKEDKEEEKKSEEEAAAGLGALFG
ncbi:MAG: 50S ribosomal protein P1 [Candidatus Nanoarchaeia archaeon]